MPTSEPTSAPLIQEECSMDKKEVDFEKMYSLSSYVDIYLKRYSISI